MAQLPDEEQGLAAERRIHAVLGTDLHTVAAGSTRVDSHLSESSPRKYGLIVRWETITTPDEEQSRAIRAIMANPQGDTDE